MRVVRRGGTPSVSGGRYTPLPPPPCGARKTLRTFVCLRFSTAAEIPASLLNALPHLPLAGLFHDGPPTARLRRFRSRFFCHRQRVTGILPLAARSRNSPGGGGKAGRVPCGCGTGAVRGDTPSVSRLAGDRRLPPPPEGEARRAGGHPFRQPPRGGSAAATSPGGGGKAGGRRAQAFSPPRTRSFSTCSSSIFCLDRG